jgi:hypothetical protein
MPFEAGYAKRGGRQVGTPNKVGREARERARRLLDDPEYWNSLKARLVQGQAPRVEIHLWELAYGKPRAELDEAPAGTDLTADFPQLLERLGEDPNRQPAPPGVDRHDGNEDPGRPTSASPETNEGEN